MLALLLASCVINNDHYYELSERIASGDRDEDGYADADEGGADCDDLDATIYPGADEVWYDGVDQDCDPVNDDDADGDGASAAARGGQDCDDEDPTVGPHAEESWENAFLDADCDGERAVIQAEFGSATWYGEGEGAHAGRRVSEIGSVVEGEPALYAAAAVFEDGRYTMGGEVYLLQGVDGGALGQRPSLIAEDESWYLGTGLGGGPDITGDGLPDLSVGATGADEGAGVAFLVSGADLASLSGENAVSSVATLQITGPQAGAYSATSLGSVADMDGDGLAELVISAPYRDLDDLVDAGQIAVFAGASVSALSDGVASFEDADILWDGYYEGAVFGNFVQSAGDQDGDGLADLMISADQGVSAVIVSGDGDGGSLEDDHIARVTREGTSPIPRIVGDVDGDGTSDLALLDEAAWLMVELAGRPEQQPSDAYTTVSTGGDSPFYDASDLGDRDGDGRAETALSVPSYSSVETSWLGLLGGDELSFGSTLSAMDLRVTALSLRPESGFGYRMANVGDVTGEGVTHLALGGWSDAEGGVEAGAVTLVEVP